MAERATKLALNHVSSSSGVWLRRKCACGGHVQGGGACEHCAAKRLQRKADSAHSQSMVPASVHGVLQAAGRPLDAGVRARMEHGFGHDFSGVRVHDGADAARSASDVRAAAYTVGAHVVFGAGRYAPKTPEGTHLLAHELAHVVQRGDGVMRRSLSGLKIGDEDSAAERDADNAANQIVHGGRATPTADADATLQRAPLRQPAIVGLDPAGPDADLAGKTEDTLWQCMKGTDPIPQECPQAPLTWADFPIGGKGSSFQANTGWMVKEAPMDPKAATCLQNVLGWSSDQTHVFQATFDPKTSFVKNRVANPTSPSATGCDKAEKKCKDNFTQQLPANQVPGPFTFTPTGSPDCPATMAGAPVVANAIGDCPQITAACLTAEQAESARILKHEQGHMDIACAMARKFNMALRQGSPFNVLNRDPRGFIQRIQDRYDAESHHGCLSGPQAAWEAEIASGLPKEALPKAQAPARKPRRRP